MQNSGFIYLFTNEISQMSSYYYINNYLEKLGYPERKLLEIFIIYVI